MVFVYPLHPTAGAKVVLALGEAQVIRQAVVLPDVAKGVVAGRPRDGRRSAGGRAASDDNRTGITLGPGKKQQARRDRPPNFVAGGDRAGIRTNPRQARGIDECGAVRAVGACRSTRIGEVARQKTLAGLHIRNNRAIALPQPLLEPFVISEHEQLVLLQWTSDGSSELMPFERNLFGREEVPGIQNVIPVILEEAAMPVVRSRRGHDTDLPSRPFPILRA